MKLNKSRLILKSREIRRDVLKMVARAGASHVGSALSCTDILTALYFAVANIDSKNPQKINRDRIILSKGHAGVGLLATLANRGFFPKRQLLKYCENGTPYTGHTMRDSAPGIEVTTGSLGHGLSIGLGMALAMKADRLKSKVFVILSDGELDEGSCWESILTAGNFRLDNLVAIVDYNKIQSFGTVKEVMDLEPLSAKWQAFKWNVREVNGHDVGELTRTLASTPFAVGMPSVVIAHTVKGKGVSFMENRLEWHYKSPDADQLERALEELS